MDNKGHKIAAFQTPDMLTLALKRLFLDHRRGTIIPFMKKVLHHIDNLLHFYPRNPPDCVPSGGNSQTRKFPSNSQSAVVII